jgi:hypothetical protein
MEVAVTSPCLGHHGSHHIKIGYIGHTGWVDKRIAIDVVIEGSYSDNLVDCSYTELELEGVGAAASATSVDVVSYIGCIDTFVISFKKMGIRWAQNGNKTENRSIGTDR